MTLLLLLLAIVPIAAFRWTGRRHPEHRYLLSGVALGMIVYPLSLGLYATYFIPYVGLVPGLLGLASSMFHGAPGYNIAVNLGIIPSHEVVHGSSEVYLAIVHAVIWAIFYGGLGWIIDRRRRRRRHDG